MRSFSTKDRYPWLNAEVRQELHPYLVGVLDNIGCPSVQTGGAEDHVHILFRLSRTSSVSQVIEKSKSSTSRWIKQRWPDSSGFAWQSGYGAFSVRPSEAGRVIDFINGQEEHHRKTTYQDELRALLREAGLELDERYLWDRIASLQAA